MENITLGSILAVIVFLGTFIGGIAGLLKYCKRIISKILEPTNNKIDSLESNLNKRIDNLEQNLNSKTENLELNQCKNYLVNFMSDAENDSITKEQVQNAYEMFDRYKKLGGNSYIHDKWEKLKKGGKI